MNNTTDQQRFYDVAWPHMAAVLRTAQCLTHSLADAEDLAQETMIKAFKAINTIRTDGTAKAWLMSILRRTRIDHLRVAKDEASLDQLEIVLARDDAFIEPDPDEAWHDPEAILNAFSDEDSHPGAA